MQNDGCADGLWQPKSSDFITDIDELLDLLKLPLTLKSTLYPAKHFALRVPRAFVGKMVKGDPQDPLLLQVLPQSEERQTHLGYSADPLQEYSANAQRSIIHKYQSRLLLTLTGACAVHCRYCFRQHFDYQQNLPKARDWQQILGYIKKHPHVHEIILSGGDPLMLSNTKLKAAIAQLASLPQLTTLRIHSRTPVVCPERIDAELVDILSSTRFGVVLVLHANHPNEIDHTLATRLTPLWQAGITLLNQSVLLKGINDNADTLAALSHKLFTAHVLPYYLHMLDKVQGSAHFDIERQAAKSIHTQLMCKLSGYLVPKLVSEEAGQPHKVAV